MRIACKRHLGQPSEPNCFTLPPSKYRRLHAFWKIACDPFGGEEKLTTTIVLHGTSPMWTRGRPTKGAPDERNVKQGERKRKKNMKHRASFAWKRLRRLEIGHLTAAPR